MRWIAIACTLAATLVDVSGGASSEVVAGPPPPPLPVNAESAAEEPRTLEAMLAAWFEASRGFEPAEADINRFVYDTIFETEARATGFYRYERPFVFRLELRPAPVRKGLAGSMRNDRGEPFELVPDKAEGWFADGRRVKCASLGDNGWEESDIGEIAPAAIDAGFLGIKLWTVPWRIEASWIPFATGITPEDIDRFHWSLGAARDDGGVLLHAIPRRQSDAACYRALNVLLDRRVFRTRAVRIHVAAGAKQTVYHFTEWREIPPGSAN